MASVVVISIQHAAHEAEQEAAINNLLAVTAVGAPMGDIEASSSTAVSKDDFKFAYITSKPGFFD
jgi:hypothetical protein